MGDGQNRKFLFSICLIHKYMKFGKQLRVNPNLKKNIQMVCHKYCKITLFYCLENEVKHKGSKCFAYSKISLKRYICYCVYVLLYYSHSNEAIPSYISKIGCECDFAEAGL